MRAYRHPIMRPLTSCWASSLTRSSGPRRRFSQSAWGGASGVAPLAPPRPSRRSLLFRLLRSRGQAAALHHDDGERLVDVAVLVERDGAGDALVRADLAEGVVDGGAVLLARVLGRLGRQHDHVVGVGRETVGVGALVLVLIGLDELLDGWILAGVVEEGGDQHTFDSGAAKLGQLVGRIPVGAEELHVHAELLGLLRDLRALGVVAGEEPVSYTHLRAHE